ncbi:MAG: ATP-binding protein [Planctomycetaceae bacterium]|nr:ATP-binding protein [Planctomycetaceae bacterium]
MPSLDQLSFPLVVNHEPKNLVLLGLFAVLAGLAGGAWIWYCSKHRDFRRQASRELRRQALPLTWMFGCCAAVAWVLEAPSLWSHATMLVLLIGWGLIASDVIWLITGWSCCGGVAVAMSQGVGPLAGIWAFAAALGAIAGLSKRRLTGLEHPVLQVRRYDRWSESSQPEAPDLGRELSHVSMRLGLLTECLPIGVFEADSAGRCRFMTPICSEILGVSFLDGFIGSWFDHVIAEDRGEAAANWRAAWRRNEPFSTECRVLAQDGGQRWIHVRCRPLTTDFGGVFLGTVEDITEQRRTARQLKRLAETLERARVHELEKNQRLESLVAALKQSQEDAESGSRAKSEFLANMSHEIRTPMTAILGFTDVLLEEAGEALPAETPLRTIRRNAEYLLELLNDVLDLSKIEARHLEVEHVRCSPRQIAADVINLMNVRVRDRNLQLVCDVDDSFPDSVVTDPTRVKQILVNLVGNAIKFTEQGTVSVRLSLEPAEVPSEPVTHNLVLRVTDTGIGMSAEQISRLFRPFSQADSSTTRKFGGTGLGLTICKAFIEMLNGQIRVTSQPGQGSTFAVILPAIDVQHRFPSVEANAASAILQNLASAPVTRLPAGSRVLLAEDGLDNQRLVTFILNKAGAEVVVVGNGREAVDEALRASVTDCPFDAILMDMQMPVLDGYEATRQLRTAGYVGPIIALTAHAMSGDREKCLAAGCSDYARKPIQRWELVAMLERLIRGDLGRRSEFLSAAPAEIPPI